MYLTAEHTINAPFRNESRTAPPYTSGNLISTPSGNCTPTLLSKTIHFQDFYLNLVALPLHHINIKT
jgi:hypothetical protein